MNALDFTKRILLTVLVGLCSHSNANANAYTFRSYVGGMRPAVAATPAVTFATLDPAFTGVNVALSAGNLVSTSGGGWQQSSARGTIGVSTGKWYWEATMTSGNYGAFGIASSTSAITTPWADAGEYVYYTTGNKFNNNISSGAAYGAGWGQSDVIGIALDMNVGTLAFYKNGVSQGVAYSGLVGTFYPFFGQGSTPTVVERANFGATPLAYPLNGYNQGLYK